MRSQATSRGGACVVLVALSIGGLSCESQRREETAAVETETSSEAFAGFLIDQPRITGDQSVTDRDQSAAARVPAQKPARVRPAKPRIEPVKKEEWTAQQQELMAPFERTGRLYNVFTTMANHPDLARDWLTFATYILRNNSLPPRDREILILRIGWLCQAEYEWAQHVVIGKAAGLTDDDVRRIAEGPAAAGLSDHDRALLVATDELREDSCLSDATWKELAKTYNNKQMMDLVFTVGQYNLVSMALNSFGVQLDAGLTGFSK